MRNGKDLDSIIMCFRTPNFTERELRSFQLMELVTLITGGASGLGKCTAQYLAKRGVKVGLLDLPVSNGGFIAKIIGHNCLYLPADVTQEKDVQNAVDKVKEKFGRLDAVVNCAGVSFNRKILSFKYYDPDDDYTGVNMDFRKVFTVNVMGTLNVIRSVVGLIAENEVDELGYRGVVINTSSFSAFEPALGQTYDAISSGAVSNATQALALEHAKAGVRFVTIAAGLFRTPLITSHLSEMSANIYERFVPLPSRFGVPEEFAALVQHVMQNRFLNGEVIRLDGALRMPP